ncbi:hypothetical protein LNKW23_35910 [Paralimibaculum aggregatum]|uniref:Uncharacterized protein n=1 Tax=Paralimibaculum aggregatum TaxID=3036245 RepID=A0ABQ6LMF0_9RHOB|nr:hypothetical protein LNKW23_35910 [Limibaculum sp. NKW23]
MMMIQKTRSRARLKIARKDCMGWVLRLAGCATHLATRSGTGKRGGLTGAEEARIGPPPGP